MIDETPPGTRGRILRIALELFAERGFHATSVREIAEQVGVTKAAVLYHFPAKAEILAALAEPMLRDLEDAITVAEAAPAGQARRATLEGTLDVLLRHRRLLRTNLTDPSSTTGEMMARYSAALLRANALVAGAEADFAGRVLASQAIAMLTDPVVLFADAPEDELREAVLRGLHRLLPTLPAPSAREDDPAHGPRRGRPAVMTTEMIETARRRHASGTPAAEIAADLDISRATLYRHLTSG